MKIFVNVKPGAKHTAIEKISANIYKIWVREPARDGLANQAIIKALAEHFKVAPSQVVIKKGLKNKKKLVEILY